MTRLSKLLLSSTILLAVAGLVYNVPTLMISKIQKDYNITLESFSIDPQHITLHDVGYVRQGITAHAKRVVIPWDRKTVQVYGVEAEVDYDALDSKDSKASSSTVKQVYRLHVKIKKKDATLEVSGGTAHVSSSAKWLYADMIQVRHPFGQGVATGAFIDISHKTASVQAISGQLTKKLPLEGDIVAQYVTVDTHEVQALSLAVGSTVAKFPRVTLDVNLNPVSITAQGYQLNHPWLAATSLSSDNPLEITFDGTTANLKYVSTEVTWQKDNKQFEGKGTCSAWVSALPVELQAPLKDISFTGSLSFHVRYGEKPALSLKGRCVSSCSAPQLKALSSKFEYDTLSSKNEWVSRTSGPRTQDWMPLALLPNALPTAVITMEDPGFIVHRGWISQAFENSLIDNLKHGKFVRGGSTITMQLAKNLWLGRAKTLSRKVQEIFLASAIESCYSKDQILEAYLNVVEFGLDTYGIGAASQHWFHKNASELTPPEAFWLASILPHPRTVKAPDLERAKKLLDRLTEDGRVTLDENPEGLQEW